MSLTYEQARRQAEASIDAFNRQDPDAIVDMLHETVAHRGPFVADHLGHERGRMDGKQAMREFLRWLWAKEPPLRHVLDEVFVGSEGFAFLTHAENDGTRYVFVNQVDDEGLVRDLQVYHGLPPAR